MPRARGLTARVTTPQQFVAYAPYGVGLMCALVYFERGPDVYGWWIGARDAEWLSAYFKLDEFFTTRQTRFLATEGMDLYGGWKRLYSARETRLDKPEPATGETYAQVPDSDEPDVQRAVQAAARAFPAWSATPATERSRMLRRIADAIRGRMDAFARAESIDTGKPLSVASTVDIPRSILNFEVNDRQIR